MTVLIEDPFVMSDSPAPEPDSKAVLKKQTVLGAMHATCHSMIAGAPKFDCALNLERLQEQLAGH